MTTAIAAPKCLVCDTEFEVQEDWEKGEITECTACGQEHEVVERSAAGARLDLAPEVEEDWGE
ncbi:MULTISPECIES: lysine biosynthesis protein LysW [Streptomyces]|jgi:alpha-aminoadipate carrier protein LysW|uniref:Lysine biosynthesis protein LysW n=1 Tax=Streptomyces europaeiscabiei TaxID=146819 RepID=A0ABU4NCJ6_9ACTN|nr:MULTISPECIES: lysine biosynthesis protein LysW [Streptomyces]MCC9704050.1 lysine biosynthesis protein LysW [Streptomyces sp. MNU76]MDX2526805.1 lysine biosynthesis protein LysW [Streptomyces europaeiscabiei]MDX2762319.1 lysine biosynthesis protein LysW [Streptomyces europaeiscabiei]MDX2772012.1 lysine biosynthesis protein LysW [Streptomyces europaeiscabiei]MDX3541439.1 lysine biosynthesis protein LysW [Streptomyces europaeiscabiei]